MMIQRSTYTAYLIIINWLDHFVENNHNVYYINNKKYLKIQNN